MENEYLELISVNVWHMVFTIVNLLILTLILKKFLFDRVKKVLADRQSQVDEIYREAEESRDAAMRDKTEYHAKLEQADEEAQNLIKKASQRAERRSDEIIDAANRKAEETLKKSRCRYRAGKEKGHERPQKRNFRDFRTDCGEYCAARNQRKRSPRVDRRFYRKALMFCAGRNLL